VSHDLKSPLRAIKAYGNIILEEHNETLDDGTNEMLHNVDNICSNMIIMIEKLMEYSKMTHLSITKEEVNISEMFTSAFEECISICPERFIKFEFETGMPTVLADSVLLRQVIYNIISNAIKFTRNKEKASIIAGCKRGIDEYIFYVKDNGVGINMEFSKKLFGIFQRLHSSDEFEGNGIGLATVRKIIQRHGGKTWIEGKVNEGTVVYFTLPVKLN